MVFKAVLIFSHWINKVAMFVSTARVGKNCEELLSCWKVYLEVQALCPRDCRQQVGVKAASRTESSENGLYAGGGECEPLTMLSYFVIFFFWFCFCFPNLIGLHRAGLLRRVTILKIAVIGKVSLGYLPFGKQAKKIDV